MRPSFTLLAVLLITSLVTAAVPQQINYQGHLTRTDGTPLDTTVAMTFKLYTDSTAGTLLWTETRPAVAVAHGLFNVRLGQLTAMTDAILNQPQIWLGTTVGGDAEMTPRAHIVSVGYSYRVGTVDGASGGTITGDVSIVGKGNIGTGNTNPGTGAFVAGSSCTASGNYSTVSGGMINLAAGHRSVVSGGSYNWARGDYSAVGGGGGVAVSDSNVVAGVADHGTISGGRSNSVLFAEGTIGGGESNKASR